MPEVEPVENRALVIASGLRYDAMTMTTQLQYPDSDLEALRQTDKRLAGVIDRMGRLEWGLNPDLFSALVTSIVSQQISSQAADTVCARLLAVLGEMTPSAVDETPVETIQQCGMSMRKARYIKAAGEAVHSRRIDLTSLVDCSDEVVVERLTRLPGIGVWTAEMMLIFSLGRPDVLSYGDLAIRRGLSDLHGHKDMPRDRFERYRRRYSPYCSLASLYLWKLADTPS